MSPSRRSAQIRRCAPLRPFLANVLLRFLVETPASIPPKFRGVFSFFRKLEQEEISAHLPELVVFQAFFVLTSHYRVPGPVAAEKLAHLILFRGIQMTHKHIMLDCLQRQQESGTDLVDAWLAAWCNDHKVTGVYSFDAGLKKQGLELRTVH